ncbi:NAD-dependent epimerase/dehydratase family protein [Nitrosomonas sp. sh817]|uniref:NAD-dependent epimerase/dehydratase family protein n=1 Tax=Nitrosomonas sp. sh817 TaxID=3070658 RepID=UPI0027DCB381|nr:NAD-dependent epimerase/dehydratase family protein [Nitrosomonas sp. sh817]WMJ09064.1 NAD-dependent epimerase/dehydratase family protein [Nitrosomonas sp. sh817]
MSNRRSLVTGGGGFIGSHLVRQLQENGDIVRVLELPDVPLPANVEVVRGTICDPHVVRKALKGVQRLYHLAGNPNLWAQKKSDFNRVNFEGTRTIFAEAAKHDLEVIVYTSTESIVTGNALRNVPAFSALECQLNEMPGPYCKSKLLAELEALKAAESGLPVVIVAPTLPVGPGDRSITPPTRMILDFLNVKTPAYLDCRFNMADVRDIAQGHILAAARGKPGQRYILGNENITLGQLLTWIEEITGLLMPKKRIPYGLALIAAVVSEFVADYMTHKPPMAPLAGVRLARYPMHFDCSKAVNDLGLPQNSVRQAVADEIEWLLDSGLVMRRLPLLREI